MVSVQPTSGTVRTRVTTSKKKMVVKVSHDGDVPLTVTQAGEHTVVVAPGQTVRLEPRLPQKMSTDRDPLPFDFTRALEYSFEDGRRFTVQASTSLATMFVKMPPVS